ncbi:uncharacterized protein Z518_02460 [Rhinocladiella mackenziei CBS 650.93]|uniref:Uncharacterized protein n=1 Tax=Rhinocladiella mackenziei CBS 650.93 TaxID=1442369 RepID=A0A0D2IWP5_9EURO|nr:uncharacterized protein Z518_02460 [Rhinocladiella mackenziei CBS 650.93]KIX07806.1 hypothetical protein Z518_02460 [Rhinocladiella mackenziei CBS 650.93]
MAHKHNRRRVRPRGRNRNALSLNFDISDNLMTSFDSSTPFPSSTSEISRKQTPGPPIPHSLNNGLASRHWHNRYIAWHNREMAQKREAVKIEAEQIKLFGGEPGDDVGLCYKMMEVFEGMNWIDTLD